MGQKSLARGALGSARRVQGLCNTASKGCLPWPAPLGNAWLAPALLAGRPWCLLVPGAPAASNALPPRLPPCRARWPRSPPMQQALPIATPSSLFSEMRTIGQPLQLAPRPPCKPQPMDCPFVSPAGFVVTAATAIYTCCIPPQVRALSGGQPCQQPRCVGGHITLPCCHVFAGTALSGSPSR